MELPGLADGVDGLLGLADLLGVSPIEVYRFLGFIRDNNNGGAIVGEVRQILAIRMVVAQQATDGTSFDKARVTVATRLGIPADQRPNFNDLLRDGQAHAGARADPGWQDQPLTGRTLPGVQDDIDGLLGMLPTYGLSAEQLFKFLGWLKYSSGAKIVGAARQILAARMVVNRMRREGEDQDEAQKQVAIQIGYSLYKRPNFYKRARDGMQRLSERGEV